jgi:hypothetical protein
MGDLAAGDGDAHIADRRDVRGRVFADEQHVGVEPGP